MGKFCKSLSIAVFVFIISSFFTFAFATSATVSVSGSRGLITISGSATFPLSPTGQIIGGSLSFYVDGAYVGGTSTTTLSSLSYSVPYDSTQAIDGSHTFSTKAIANDKSTASAAIAVTTYNTPEITINSPSGATTGVVKCNISYDFPSSPRGGSIAVSLIKPGVVNSSLKSKDVILNSSAPTSGTFEFDFDSTQWVNDSYQIQVKAYVKPLPLRSTININITEKSITTSNTPKITINSPSWNIRGVVRCSISYEYPSSPRKGTLAVYLVKPGVVNSYLKGKDVILSSSALTSGTLDFSFNSAAWADDVYQVQVKAYINPPPFRSRINISDTGKDVLISNNVSADETIPLNKSTLVGEPINVANGNMFTSKTDISIPAREIALELSRTYNSQDNFNGGFGWGWRSNFDITLTQKTALFVIEVDETGVSTMYGKSSLSGIYFTSPGNHSVLTKNTDGTYTIVKKEGKKLSFDINGRLIKIEGRNGNAVNILRDSSGVISEVSDSANRKLLFTKNSSGRITQVSDPAGRIFKYEYDANSNLTKTIDPLNNQALYQYDSAHNLIRFIDENSHTLYFQYDSSGRAYHSWQDGGNNEVTLSYNPAAKTTDVTDSLGNTSRYEYNDYGLVVKITNSQNAVQSFTWDADLNKTSLTNQNGFTTFFTYDNKANLLSVKDPLNNITTFTYEPDFSLVSSITNAAGKTTEYLYDIKGNLIQVKDALNNLTKHSYDASGALIQTQDANNNISTFSYDAYGNLAVLTNALNSSTNFSYDVLGNSIQVTDAKGNATQFGYDLLNRLKQVTYPDGSKVGYTYDAVGNLITLTDAANQNTTYTYDVVDRLIQLTDASGNITKYNYDKEGNKLSVIDANLNTTQYTYDSLYRLIKTVDVLNKQTGYVYDPAGNLISVTDAKGNVTNYTYDANNRRAQTIYPDNSKEEYSYDVNSNLAAKTAPNGKIIYYEYDILNRLVEKGLIPKGSVPDSTVTYSYDAGSRLNRVTDKNGVIAYEFDALNRMTKVTYPDGKSVAYAYDANSNRAKLTYPDSSYITYDYDRLNRLAAIKDESANLVASYAYDVLSRRQQLSYANGTQTVYTYDSANRLIQLANRKTGQPVNFSQYDYTYDNAGNRLNKTTASPIHQAPATENYTYDKLYQLIQSAVDSPQSTVNYNYDAVGNRISTVNGGTTNYTSNNLNQYTQVGSTTYAYDANGNLTNDGVRTYAYDYENRLASVIASESEAIYNYDAFGRRIKKSVTHNSELLTQNYLYDGDQVIAEYDGAGNLTKKYIYGPGIDQPIQVASFKSQVASKYYYYYDGLGSVTDLTDSTGAVVETYSYDAFGQPTIKDVSGLTLQVSSIGNRFMFTAREYDNETELYYYRARYYNTTTGRFLQRDPLGYVDGPNPYTYCLNAPINWVDPLGLCVEKEQWWENIDFDYILNQFEDFSNSMAANPMSDGSPYPFEQLWLIGTVSSKTGRVFWSGSKVAMMRAKEFAEHTGRVTLEMTKAGQRLMNSLGTGRARWVYASSQFAKGAKGIVHVFRKAKVATDSIWKLYEEPILRNSSKVKEIIEHIIK